MKILTFDDFEGRDISLLGILHFGFQFDADNPPDFRDKVFWKIPHFGCQFDKQSFLGILHFGYPVIPDKIATFAADTLL